MYGISRTGMNDEWHSSWRHLGVILASSWRHLGVILRGNWSCASDGWPMGFERLIVPLCIIFYLDDLVE